LDGSDTLSAIIDLLGIGRGSVVAPAGCGKTHSIVDAVARSVGKPVLVLTHTNAGVCALRTRLARGRVAAARSRVATLDGWALQIVLAYPELTGLRPDLSAISYPALRDAAIRALASGALDVILRATYGRVIVDEYQDCSDQQHRLVLELARSLPCAILGDPLQRIFDFGGTLPDWQGQVLVDFPLAGELDEPFRWVNAGEPAYGQWILHLRARLLAGAGADLTSVPTNVTWIDTSAPGSQWQAEQRAMAALAGIGDQHALIVGDARNRDARAEFARRHSHVEVVEPVDLTDLMQAVGPIAVATGADRVTRAIVYAASIMTGIDQALFDHLQVVADGQAAPNGAAELAFLAALAAPSWRLVGRMLEALADDPVRRVFRPELLSALCEGARRAEAMGGDLRAGVLAIREARRVTGRALPKVGIGSTLLLKGLEADHAMIQDATGLNARHLYVAMSRASRSLAVLSSRGLIGLAP
jgi:hypothetical protein